MNLKNLKKMEVQELEMKLNLNFLVITNAEQVIDRGFECELDGVEIDCTDDTSESFTSIEEFNNLPEGTHTFTVTAFVDVSNGETPMTIKDQTPER